MNNYRILASQGALSELALLGLQNASFLTEQQNQNLQQQKRVQESSHFVALHKTAHAQSLSLEQVLTSVNSQAPYACIQVRNLVQQRRLFIEAGNRAQAQIFSQAILQVLDQLNSQERSYALLEALSLSGPQIGEAFEQMLSQELNSETLTLESRQENASIQALMILRLRAEGKNIEVPSALQQFLQRSSLLHQGILSALNGNLSAASILQFSRVRTLSLSERMLQRFFVALGSLVERASQPVNLEPLLMQNARSFDTQLETSWKSFEESVSDFEKNFVQDRDNRPLAAQELRRAQESFESLRRRYFEQVQTQMGLSGSLSQQEAAVERWRILLHWSQISQRFIEQNYPVDAHESEEARQERVTRNPWLQAFREGVAARREVEVRTLENIRQNLLQANDHQHLIDRVHNLCLALKIDRLLGKDEEIVSDSQALSVCIQNAEYNLLSPEIRFETQSQLFWSLRRTRQRLYDESSSHDTNLIARLQEYSSKIQDVQQNLENLIPHLVENNSQNTSAIQLYQEALRNAVQAGPQAGVLLRAEALEFESYLSLEGLYRYLEEPCSQKRNLERAVSEQVSFALNSEQLTRFENGIRLRGEASVRLLSEFVRVENDEANNANEPQRELHFTEAYQALSTQQQVELLTQILNLGYREALNQLPANDYRRNFYQAKLHLLESSRAHADSQSNLTRAQNEHLMLQARRELECFVRDSRQHSGDDVAHMRAEARHVLIPLWNKDLDFMASTLQSLRTQREANVENHLRSLRRGQSEEELTATHLSYVAQLRAVLEEDENNLASIDEARSHLSQLAQQELSRFMARPEIKRDSRLLVSASVLGLQEGQIPPLVLSGGTLLYHFNLIEINDHPQEIHVQVGPEGGRLEIVTQIANVQGDTRSGFALSRRCIYQIPASTQGGLREYVIRADGVHALTSVPQGQNFGIDEGRRLQYHLSNGQAINLALSGADLLAPTEITNGEFQNLNPHTPYSLVNLQNRSSALYLHSLVSAQSFEREAPFDALLHFVSDETLNRRVESLSHDRQAFRNLASTLRGASNGNGSLQTIIEGRRASYQSAAEILENLMEPQWSAIVQESEIQGIQQKVRREHYQEIVEQVQHQIDAQSQTISHQPNRSEKEAMIEQSLNARAEIEVNQLRYQRMRTLREQGRLNSEMSALWDEYNELMDPNGEWFTFSDAGIQQSINQITELVVMEVMTMGAGAAEFGVRAVGEHLIHRAVTRGLLREGVTGALVREGGTRLGRNILQYGVQEGARLGERLIGTALRKTLGHAAQMSGQRLVLESLLWSAGRVAHNTAFVAQSSLVHGEGFQGFGRRVLSNAALMDGFLRGGHLLHAGMGRGAQALFSHRNVMHVARNTRRLGTLGRIATRSVVKISRNTPIRFLSHTALAAANRSSGFLIDSAMMSVHTLAEGHLQGNLNSSIQENLLMTVGGFVLGMGGHPLTQHLRAADKLQKQMMQRRAEVVRLRIQRRVEEIFGERAQEQSPTHYRMLADAEENSFSQRELASQIRFILEARLERGEDPTLTESLLDASVREGLERAVRAMNLDPHSRLGQEAMAHLFLYSLHREAEVEGIHRSLEALPQRARLLNEALNAFIPERGLSPASLQLQVLQSLLQRALQSRSENRAIVSLERLNQFAKKHQQAVQQILDALGVSNREERQNFSVRFLWNLAHQSLAKRDGFMAHCVAHTEEIRNKIQEAHFVFQVRNQSQREIISQALFFAALSQAKNGQDFLTRLSQFTQSSCLDFVDHVAHQQTRSSLDEACLNEARCAVIDSLAALQPAQLTQILQTVSLRPRGLGQNYSSPVLAPIPFSLHQGVHLPSVFSQTSAEPLRLRIVSRDENSSEGNGNQETNDQNSQGFQGSEQQEKRQDEREEALNDDRMMSPSERAAREQEDYDAVLAKAQESPQAQLALALSKALQTRLPSALPDELFVQTENVGHSLELNAASRRGNQTRKRNSRVGLLASSERKSNPPGPIPPPASAKAQPESVTDSFYQIYRDYFGRYFDLAGALEEAQNNSVDLRTLIASTLIPTLIDASYSSSIPGLAQIVLSKPLQEAAEYFSEEQVPPQLIEALAQAFVARVERTGNDVESLQIIQHTPVNGEGVSTLSDYLALVISRLKDPSIQSPLQTKAQQQVLRVAAQAPRKLEVNLEGVAEAEVAAELHRALVKAMLPCRSMTDLRAVQLLNPAQREAMYVLNEVYPLVNRLAGMFIYPDYEAREAYVREHASPAERQLFELAQGDLENSPVIRNSAAYRSLRERYSKEQLSLFPAGSFPEAPSAYGALWPSNLSPAEHEALVAKFNVAPYDFSFDETAHPLFCSYNVVERLDASHVPERTEEQLSKQGIYRLDFEGERRYFRVTNIAQHSRFKELVEKIAQVFENAAQVKTEDRKNLNFQEQLYLLGIRDSIRAGQFNRIRYNEMEKEPGALFVLFQFKAWAAKGKPEFLHGPKVVIGPRVSDAHRYFAESFGDSAKASEWQEALADAVGEMNQVYEASAGRMSVEEILEKRKVYLVWPWLQGGSFARMRNSSGMAYQHALLEENRFLILADVEEAAALSVLQGFMPQALRDCSENLYNEEMVKRVALIRVYGHELTHGIGANANKVLSNGQTIAQVHGRNFEAMDEARAEAGSLLMASQLYQRALLSKAEFDLCCDTQLAMMIRLCVTKEALNEKPPRVSPHGVGARVMLRYFLEHNAIAYDDAGKFYIPNRETYLRINQQFYEEVRNLVMSPEASPLHDFIYQTGLLNEAVESHILNHQKNRVDVLMMRPWNFPERLEETGADSAVQRIGENLLRVVQQEVELREVASEGNDQIYVTGAVVSLKAGATYRLLRRGRELGRYRVDRFSRVSWEPNSNLEVFNYEISLGFEDKIPNLWGACCKQNGIDPNAKQVPFHLSLHSVGKEFVLLQRENTQREDANGDPYFIKESRPVFVKNSLTTEWVLHRSNRPIPADALIRVGEGADAVYIQLKAPNNPAYDAYVKNYEISEKTYVQEELKQFSSQDPSGRIIAEGILPGLVLERLGANISDSQLRRLTTNLSQALCDGPHDEFVEPELLEAFVDVFADAAGAEGNRLDEVINCLRTSPTQEGETIARCLNRLSEGVRAAVPLLYYLEIYRRVDPELAKLIDYCDAQEALSEVISNLIIPRLLSQRFSDYDDENDSHWERLEYLGKVLSIPSDHFCANETVSVTDLHELTSAVVDSSEGRVSHVESTIEEITDYCEQNPMGEFETYQAYLSRIAVHLNALKPKREKSSLVRLLGEVFDASEERGYRAPHHVSLPTVLERLPASIAEHFNRCVEEARQNGLERSLDELKRTPVPDVYRFLFLEIWARLKEIDFNEHQRLLRAQFELAAALSLNGEKIRYFESLVEHIQDREIFMQALQCAVEAPREEGLETEEKGRYAQWAQFIFAAASRNRHHRSDVKMMLKDSERRGEAVEQDAFPAPPSVKEALEAAQTVRDGEVIPAHIQTVLETADALLERQAAADLVHRAQELLEKFRLDQKQKKSFQTATAELVVFENSDQTLHLAIQTRGSLVASQPLAEVPFCVDKTGKIYRLSYQISEALRVRSVAAELVADLEKISVYEGLQIRETGEAQDQVGSAQLEVNTRETLCKKISYREESNPDGKIIVVDEQSIPQELIEQPDLLGQFWQDLRNQFPYATIHLRITNLRLLASLKTQAAAKLRSVPTQEGLAAQTVFAFAIYLVETSELSELNSILFSNSSNSQQQAYPEFVALVRRLYERRGSKFANEIDFILNCLPPDFFARTTHSGLILEVEVPRTQEREETSVEQVGERAADFAEGPTDPIEVGLIEWSENFASGNFSEQERSAQVDSFFPFVEERIASVGFEKFLEDLETFDHPRVRGDVKLDLLLEIRKRRALSSAFTQKLLGTCWRIYSHVSESAPLLSSDAALLKDIAAQSSDLKILNTLTALMIKRVFLTRDDFERTSAIVCMAEVYIAFARNPHLSVSDKKKNVVGLKWYVKTEVNVPAIEAVFKEHTFVDSVEQWVSLVEALSEGQTLNENLDTRLSQMERRGASSALDLYDLRRLLAVCVSERNHQEELESIGARVEAIREDRETTIALLRQANRRDPLTERLQIDLERERDILNKVLNSPPFLRTQELSAAQKIKHSTLIDSLTFLQDTFEASGRERTSAFEEALSVVVSKVSERNLSKGLETIVHLEASAFFRVLVLEKLRKQNRFSEEQIQEILMKEYPVCCETPLDPSCFEALQSVVENLNSPQLLLDLLHRLILPMNHPFFKIEHFSHTFKNLMRIFEMTLSHPHCAEQLHTQAVAVMDHFMSLRTNAVMRVYAQQNVEIQKIFKEEYGVETFAECYAKILERISARKKGSQSGGGNGAPPTEGSPDTGDSSLPNTPPGDWSAAAVLPDRLLSFGDPLSPQQEAVLDEAHALNPWAALERRRAQKPMDANLVSGDLLAAAMSRRARKKISPLELEARVSIDPPTVSEEVNVEVLHMVSDPRSFGQAAATPPVAIELKRQLRIASREVEAQISLRSRPFENFVQSLRQGKTSQTLVFELGRVGSSAPIRLKLRGVTLMSDSFLCDFDILEGDLNSPQSSGILGLNISKTKGMAVVSLFTRPTDRFLMTQEIAPMPAGVGSLALYWLAAQAAAKKEPLGIIEINNIRMLKCVLENELCVPEASAVFIRAGEKPKILSEMTEEDLRALEGRRDYSFLMTPNPHLLNPQHLPEAIRLRPSGAVALNPRTRRFISSEYFRREKAAELGRVCRRQAENRESWGPHFEKLRLMSERAMRYAKQAKSPEKPLLVVHGGAGTCRDLNLNAWVEKGYRVRLVDIDEEGLRETWNKLEPQLKPHVELEFRDLSGEMVYAIEEITLRNKHLGADAVMDALEKKWAAILAKHSFDEPEADVLLSYGLAGHLLDLGLIGNNVLVDPKSNAVHPRLLVLLGQIDRDYFVRSAEVARRGGVVAFAQEIKLKTCLPGKPQELTHQDLPLSYTAEGRPNVGIDRELFSDLHVIYQDRWVWHHAAPYAEGKMNLIPAAKNLTVNEQEQIGEWRDVDALVLVREE